MLSPANALHLLLAQGKQKIHEGNYRGALDELFTAGYLLLKGDDQTRHQVELHIGLCYMHEEDYEQALPRLETAARTAHISQNKETLALMHLSLAVCYKEIGIDEFLLEQREHYKQQAKENAQQARRLFAELGNTEMIRELEEIIDEIDDGTEGWRDGD